MFVTLFVFSLEMSADPNVVIFENHIAVERGAIPSSATVVVITLL